MAITQATAGKNVGEPKSAKQDRINNFVMFLAVKHENKMGKVLPKDKVLYVVFVGPQAGMPGSGYAVVELSKEDAARVVELDKRINEVQRTIKPKDRVDTSKNAGIFNKFRPLIDERNAILQTKGKEKYYSGPKNALKDGQVVSYDEIKRLNLKQE
ncbi:MAG: hypothetical protein NT051_05945 [Candidatus Micrarchaeota archaeon]|nr:hypothetical protein [Candidatus Micrarchaeota archaeon]